MNATKGLPVEQELYRNFWDDGLLDLLAGLGVLLIGVGWQFDQPVLAAVGPALLVTMWAPLRRAIVDPRAGYVEFSAGVRARESRGRWMLVSVGVIALLAGIGAYVVAMRGGVMQIGPLVAGLPAVLLGVGAALAGGVLRLPRFTAYAMALVVLGAITVLYGLRPGAPMLVAGPIVLGSGVVLMARFLRDHPATESVDE